MKTMKIMKAHHLLLIAGAVLALGGCSTNQGGTTDEYNTGYTGYSTGYGQGTNPTPSGTPTFNPGMNSQDIRDPNALTRPQPPPTMQPPETPPVAVPGSTP
jgi:hypothetical protein